jgi:hypothetical protein
MKTFVSAVAVISAFAGWVDSGCAFPDTAPGAAKPAAPKSSTRSPTVNLPPQFAKTWKIDECEGVPPMTPDSCSGTRSRSRSQASPSRSSSTFLRGDDRAECLDQASSLQLLG